ncbi:MAG: tetratricopeptide repeat protein [Pseudomonadota bacterium]
MAKSLSVDQAMKQAKSLASQGRVGDARVIYQQILAKFPANKRAAQALKGLAPDPQQTAQMRIQAALNDLIKLFNLGRYDNVITQAQEMTKSLPKLPILPNMIGAALSAKGDYEAAVPHYERALELDPTLVPAHNNLGAAKAELSLLDDAIGHYEEALKLDPTYAQAENNMANAQRQLGRIEEAVEGYRRAVSLNSKLADAHGNLGSCLFSIGQLEEALLSLRQAALLEPKKAEYPAQLGSVFQRLDRTQEAIEAYDAAVELAREPEYLNARGTLLTALHRHDAAITSFREALDLQPDSAEAWSNLCAVYDTQAKVPELAETVAAAGEAIGSWDPQNRLWAGVLAAHQGDDAKACEFLENIFQDELPTTGQIKQAETLGKCQDRLERSADAFEAFQRTNNLVMDQQARGPADPLRYVDEIAAINVSLDEAGIIDWPSSDEGSELVFLVGMPRSGFSLLGSHLRAHPLIETVEEGLMVEAAHRFLDGTATIDALSALSEAKLDAMRAAYRSALDLQIAKATPGKRVFVNQPLNIVSTPLLHRLFPAAHFVLNLRHPCDVTLSCFMHNFPLTDATANYLDLEDTVALYSLAMEAWIGSCEKLPIASSQIRYEDLRHDAKSALNPLLSELGLSWSEEMAAVQQQHGLNDGSIDGEEELGFFTVPKARWERYRSQMDPVLDTLQPWAARWGYEI